MKKTTKGRPNEGSTVCHGRASVAAGAASIWSSGPEMAFYSYVKSAGESKKIALGTPARQ